MKVLADEASLVLGCEFDSRITRFFILDLLKRNQLLQVGSEDLNSFDLTQFRLLSGFKGRIQIKTAYVIWSI